MSQSAKDYLKSEMNRLLDEAQAVTAQAESEGRDVTDDEKAQVEKLLEVASQHQARIKKIEATEDLRDRVERISDSFNEPVDPEEGEPTSIGDAFVKSTAYKAARASRTGTWSSGAVDVGEADTKATVTTVASPVVQPGPVQGPFPILTQARHVRDLLPQGTTDSNVVPVVRETTATNAAAGVAEGTAKPESTLVFTQANEPVKKIATFLPVSDEFFDDVSGMRSYIDNRLRGFVLDAEDQQLLTGAGGGNNVQGIQTRAGIQTATLAALKTASGAATPNVADAVYAAITNIRTNAFVEPDGAVFHPTNWMAVRLLKDTALQYFGGGPFTGAYGNSGGIAPNNIWGLPVVVTARETLHTALVGSFQQAMIFQRGALTVEATNSHANFFQENLIAIRAEERLALAVWRPAGFHLITALNVP
jgi:HK97 family phage major capsid protein